MNVIAEFDRLLSFREGEQSHEYAEGRDQGLATGRKLALAYVKQRQAMDMECSKLIHQLLEENHALRVQQDEARHDLARAVGLIVPGHHTFPELVAQLIEDRDRAHYDLEHHECESECENCHWGYSDGDCDECDETAATVKRAIEILEELT